MSFQVDLELFTAGGECGIWLDNWLDKPFSEGDYSYASNGHILVRVGRRPGIPEVWGKITRYIPILDASHETFELPWLPSSNDSTVGIGGVAFDTYKLRRLVGFLPRFRVAVEGGANPLFFSFTGGVGVLMAMKEPRVEHFEITLAEFKAQ